MANAAYDNGFVPSTHDPLVRAGAFPGIQAGGQTAVLTLFGPYLTNLQKAKYVYFDGSGTLLPILV
jgi:hypothetical protein